MDALTAGGDRDPRYVLGHSTGELDRLMAQARLVNPITAAFLREAGLESGMRVLDVGCGAGDVSFLAAAFVGPAGEVVGVDRSEAALDTARGRATGPVARERHLRGGRSSRDGVRATVRRRHRPIRPAVPGRPGRHAPQAHRASPTSGLAVFHELDWGGVRSEPPVPTHDRCCRWAMETLRRSGTETSMGSKLAATFVAAGLPVPPSCDSRYWSRAGEHSLGRLALVAGLVATLLPEMERQRVATAANVQLRDPVRAHARGERLATGSLVFGHWQIAAWARIGAGAAA